MQKCGLVVEIWLAEDSCGKQKPKCNFGCSRKSRVAKNLPVRLGPVNSVQWSTRVSWYRAPRLLTFSLSVEPKPWLIQSLIKPSSSSYPADMVDTPYRKHVASFRLDA